MLGRVFTLCCVVLTAQACVSPGPTTEQVLVAPLSDDGRSSTSGMTREELEDHVRRFADRYFTRIAIATDELSEISPEHRKLMHDWKTVSQTAIVDIAIGPNAVTNLLDMMTVTRLSRLVVSDRWVPNRLGEELGLPFLRTFVDLEEDIWSVADDVLTPQNQAELRELIDDWHAANPGQYYPWYIRMGNFSGQRAASLAAVQQSGGMLAEVARAREAAEEIQAFGERVLFYLQRAPMITSNELESGVSDMLQNPEIAELINNTDRFVTSVDRLVQMIDELPEERLMIIDQFMDRVAAERQAMLRDMSEIEPGLRGVLSDLQPALGSLERIMAMSKESDSDSQPFDVNEYRALVAESADTATEMRLLMESVSDLLGEHQDAAPIVNKLLEAEQSAVRHAFWYAIALIFIFFGTLLVYRVVVSRVLRE